MEYKTPQGREYGMVYLGKGECGWETWGKVGLDDLCGKRWVLMAYLGKVGLGGTMRAGLWYIGMCCQQEDACLLFHHFSITFP